MSPCHILDGPSALISPWEQNTCWFQNDSPNFWTWSMKKCWLVAKGWDGTVTLLVTFISCYLLGITLPIWHHHDILSFVSFTQDYVYFKTLSYTLRLLVRAGELAQSNQTIHHSHKISKRNHLQSLHKPLSYIPVKFQWKTNSNEFFLVI